MGLKQGDSFINNVFSLLLELIWGILLGIRNLIFHATHPITQRFLSRQDPLPDPYGSTTVKAASM